MVNTSNINTGVEKNTQNAAVELFSGSEIVFSIIQTHRASLQAQITDNFIENNTSLQDHIAFSPIAVTLSGFVGDVLLTSDAATQQVQDELSQAKERTAVSGDFLNWSNYLDPSSLVSTKLGTLFNLYPPMNNTMQLAVYNIANAYSAGKSALLSRWNNKNQAVLSNTNISTQKSRIQEAYEQVKDTFFARLPNTVLTPWATYQNMYIQGIEISQDELNRIVDISITFKQLRFASVEYGEVNEQVRANYNAAVASDVENNGKSSVRESTLHKFGGDINAAISNITGNQL